MSKEEFYSHFIKNNMKILETSFRAKNKLQYQDIINQIDLIVLFHKRFNGYRENLIPRIGSTIGKDLENYRVQVRKLLMDIKLINQKEEMNQLDLFILTNAPKIVNKGVSSIDRITKADYEGLIKRSMINYEVCLGKVDDRNLILSDEGVLNIGTVDYLTYNLVEHDLYNYIKKIKHKINIINMEELIIRYIESLSLDNRSFEYLMALLSLPVESLKVWSKFKDGKKYIGWEECLHSLKIAMKIDGII